MRKFVSISCLLLLCSSWAATAHAQQTTVPASGAPDPTVVVNDGVAKSEPAVPYDVPIVVLNNKDKQPANMPRIDFKVDLYGSGTPAMNSDELEAARALRLYDESMRNWSLPPATLDEIIAESESASGKDERFRINPRNDFSAPSRTARDFEWQRQRFADRVADVIYPGFGRIETKHANGATSRLDYIYTKRCGGRGGVGICWQYRF